MWLHAGVFCLPHLLLSFLMLVTISGMNIVIPSPFNFGIRLVFSVSNNLANVEHMPKKKNMCPNTCAKEVDDKELRVGFA